MLINDVGNVFKKALAALLVREDGGFICVIFLSTTEFLEKNHLVFAVFFKDKD